MDAYNHPINGVPGLNTNFEAVNMSVIPATSNVLVWDFNGGNQNLGYTVPWPQRFAIGNPETRVFTNGTWTIPLGPGGLHYGDLFCAGHTWLPDGRLFVAGGNSTSCRPTRSA